MLTNLLLILATLNPMPAEGRARAQVCIAIANDVYETYQYSSNPTDADSQEAYALVISACMN